MNPKHQWHREDKLKTWLEFIQGNGGDNATIPAGQGVTPPDQGDPNNMPPTKPANAPGAPDENKVLEELTNDVQRAVERLFKTLDKHQMNKQKAMGLLSTIISSVANQYGLSSTNVRQAGQQGLRTNSEPISPPLQPQVAN